MSLDVYLYREKIVSYDKGVSFTQENECIYTSNITHNLNKMAGEAGIYQVLWRPEEENIKEAKELIEPLTKGLALLKSDSKRFEGFNSPNGWGKYEHFVPFVEEYLDACKKYPEAIVKASR